MPRKTNRGFSIYSKFKDLNGSEIRVQESSLATTSAVWIFCHNDNPGLKGDAHLSVAQAKRVVVALQKFIDGK